MNRIGAPLAAEDTLTATERTRILAKSALFDPPAVALPDGRRELIGLSREELAAELAAIGEPAFRAKQLWHWIYHQGVTDFAAMTNVHEAAAREARRALRHRPPRSRDGADQQ